MSSLQNDLKYWVALNHFSKFGPLRFQKLQRFFPDMEEAFHGSVQELIHSGIEDSVAHEFSAFRQKVDPDELMDKLEKEGIEAITQTNPEYPSILGKIYNPPPVLYSKGEKRPKETGIAVVGSRKISPYGQQVIYSIIKKLSNNGLTIISGLALGTDSLAHAVTLEEGGRTVAVLGSGLDKQSIYPSSNRYLADKIIRNGGQLLSEYPHGTAPLKHHFPLRNRIISGLSLGILVVEAAEKSGSLITAKHALEQNRDIFAVPGNIFSPLSQGTNRLIKQGAIPVTSADDILDALDLSEVSNYINSNQKITPETDEERLLLSILSFEPKHVDEISRLSGLAVSILNSTLVMMEIKGIIRNLGGMQYVKII